MYAIIKMLRKEKENGDETQSRSRNTKRHSPYISDDYPIIRIPEILVR
jgi:hypothetical protein